MQIPYINSQQINTLLPYKQLISALHRGFQEDYSVPLRHHHSYKNASAGVDSTLFLMPAWKRDDYLGIKIITVSPENGQYQLPAIQGIYLLFDAKTGSPIAQFDARTLTIRRTAAASALASVLLSRPDSQRLLVVGTGNMAPALIEAHASIRPITEVYVWGRNFGKAQAIAQQMKNATYTIEPIVGLATIAKKVDIISCATLSEQALIKGEWLTQGQHIDLVGSYTPIMREADDDVIKRAVVYVDTMEGATKESGDILIPLRNGSLNLKDIQGDLFDLCRNKVRGRQSNKEITLFKSVGHALEDLIAAKLLYEQIDKK